MSVSLKAISNARHVFFGLSAIILMMAGPAQSQTINHREQYRACMDLVHHYPEEAFDSALSWQGLGGGEAAEHCIASALMKMENYLAAARRLEDLAQNSRRSKEFKAEILSQAATAWLLHDDLNQAHAVLNAALELDETNPRLYVERAQILAQKNALNEVITDLDIAILLNNDYADALVLRGSAYRLLEKFVEAESDITLALRLEPSHPEGLLERGMLYRIDGQADKAREDWLKVLNLEPDGPLGDVARRNLEKMDVQPAGPAE